MKLEDEADVPVTEVGQFFLREWYQWLIAYLPMWLSLIKQESLR